MIRRRWIGVLVCALSLAVAGCSGHGAKGGKGGGGGTGGASTGGVAGNGGGISPAGQGGAGGIATPTGGGAGTTVTIGTGGGSVVDAGQSGAAGEGGRGGSVAGTGGAATGGTAGTAGAGGSASGGAGGPSTGGAGGLGGGAAGGAAGGSDAPRPSPGCARAIAQPPGDAIAGGLEVWRKFPAGYDGVKPLPLVVAFHATGYSGTNMLRTMTVGQPAADRSVVIAPDVSQAAAPNFESHSESELVSVLKETFAELCVDQNRIYGAGSGSGGRFLIRLVDYAIKTTAVGFQFRGAGIVGTYFSGNRNRSVPTIFIHPFYSPNSVSIAQDPDGTKAIAIFRERNDCGESSTPLDVAGCVSGTKQVIPGCVDFDDCAAPLRWCQHDDPVSSGIGDPWPCFASAAIFQFFDKFGA